MQVSADLYPFEGRSIVLGGHRLHYVDEGQGAPVVMVHGNPTWSFYYRELIRDLRPDHRALALDHIGCGLSDKPSASEYPYTLARRVEDFGAWIDALDLGDDITLVVHDWGGMIAMAWAVENAARVRRIVLFNTAAFPLPDASRLPWALSFVRDTKLGAALVLRCNAFARGGTRLAVKRRMPDEVREAYCAPYDTPANRIATLRFVQDIPLSPSDPGLEIVTDTARRLTVFSQTPVLICWGEKDFVFNEPFLQQWLRYWPHAQLCRFPDAGHYVLEDASREIISRIRTFFSEHSLTTESLRVAAGNPHPHGN